MIIGKALYVFRKNLLKLTQRELSQRINVTKCDISLIEHSFPVSPGVYNRYERYFERLGKQYGYSIEEFAKVMVTGNPDADIYIYV